MSEEQAVVVINATIYNWQKDVLRERQETLGVFSLSEALRQRAQRGTPPPGRRTRRGRGAAGVIRTHQDVLRPLAAYTGADARLIAGIETLLSEPPDRQERILRPDHAPGEQHPEHGRDPGLRDRHRPGTHAHQRGALAA